jgi:hypothetical protein
MPLFFLPVLVLLTATAGAGATRRTTNREGPAMPVANNWSTQSTTHTTSYVASRKTVYDWWCNGLTGDERQILLENGYSDKSGCFGLEELKNASERMYAEKSPGKPTEKDGFKPDKKQGDKLVKNPNGQGKGWLDEKGEVWVPTGDNAHGGPHWDVQNPRTGGHRNVYPGGRVRY